MWCMGVAGIGRMGKTGPCTEDLTFEYDTAVDTLPFATYVAASECRGVRMLLAVLYAVGVRMHGHQGGGRIG